MVFPLLFNIGMDLIHTRVLFKMGEGLYWHTVGGGGIPLVGGGGSLISLAL
jgi:hypothetical protein